MDPHPFIVHFPIVCLILAALFEWLSRSQRFDQLRHTGFALLVIGALTTIPAAYTGEAASETAASLPGISEALERHEDLSTFTLWSAILLAVARIHLTLKRRYEGLARTIHTVLLTGCAVLVVLSSYTGGRLVYEFGAGTSIAPTQSQDREP